MSSIVPHDRTFQNYTQSVVGDSPVSKNHIASKYRYIENRNSQHVVPTWRQNHYASTAETNFHEHSFNLFRNLSDEHTQTTYHPGSLVLF